MELNLPNRLTLLRLFVAGGLFLILAAISHGALERRTLWFCVGALLILFCALTDALDGYIARKWKQITGFGRIADPFVDKILVLGAFILLIPISPLVPAWFVVLVVIRELTITALRGQLEGRGTPFGAGAWGKAKMLSQTILLVAVLLYEAFRADLPSEVGHAVTVLLFVTLVLTIGSGLIYLKRITLDFS